MYKRAFLFRRNPSMTREEFIDYYERTHSKLIRHFPGTKKYLRRYPSKIESFPRNPSENPNHETSNGPQTPNSFDVIMEVWFEDEAACEASDRRLLTDAIQSELIEDEKKLFDCAGENWCTMMVLDIEHETDLSTLRSTYERASVDK